MSSNETSFDYLLDSRVSLKTRKALLRETLSPEHFPALVSFIAINCQRQLAQNPAARRIFTTLLAQQDFSEKINYLTASTRLYTLFGAGATTSHEY